MILNMTIPKTKKELKYAANNTSGQNTVTVTINEDGWYAVYGAAFHVSGTQGNVTNTLVDLTITGAKSGTNYVIFEANTGDVLTCTASGISGIQLKVAGEWDSSQPTFS